MAEYYTQRAGAGLILSEATAVTPQGVGYADTPGLWTPEQVQGWRQVTAAVHAAGGRIFAQLWHVGRISDPMFLDGQLPVAPSALAARGHVSHVRPQRAYVTPRALETAELPGVIRPYRLGAQMAQEAGFDGVEVHAANGYLLDQFLQDSTNLRNDDYGGPVENRARLLLEATDACVGVWGAGRVGVHLSPRGDIHTMGDSDRAGTFGYVASELGRRRIAFLCVREHEAPDSIGPALKAAFGGAYIANEGFTRESAEAAIAAGRADAVAFGVQYIANPDLARRFALKAPLNRPNPATFYAPGPGLHGLSGAGLRPERRARGAHGRVRVPAAARPRMPRAWDRCTGRSARCSAPGAPAPPPPGRRGGRPGRRRPRQARQQHPLPAAGIVRQAEQRGRAQQCGIGAPAARAPQPAQPFLDVATEQRFFRQRHQQGIVDQPQPAVVRPFGAQPTMPSASASVRHTSTAAAPQASVARSVRPASRPIMTGGRARMIQNATRGLSRFRYMLNGTASGLSDARGITSGLWNPGIRCRNSAAATAMNSMWPASRRAVGAGGCTSRAASASSAGAARAAGSSAPCVPAQA